MSAGTCDCDACVRQARRKAVAHEFGLIWASQDDGQDAGAAYILASQIDDVEMLRELVAMLATSARL